MSSNERERLKVLARVKRGELNLKEAAELLGISYRQCRRLHKRHQGWAIAVWCIAVADARQNRGHEATVLARYQARYPDFGPTLAAEKLAADGYEVDHETLRRWLVRRDSGVSAASVPYIVVGASGGHISASATGWPTS